MTYLLVHLRIGELKMKIFRSMTTMITKSNFVFKMHFLIKQFGIGFLCIKPIFPLGRNLSFPFTKSGTIIIAYALKGTISWPAKSLVSKKSRNSIWWLLLNIKVNLVLLTEVTLPMRNSLFRLQ